METNEVDDMND